MDILSHEDFVAHLERRCQELMAENERLRNVLREVVADEPDCDMEDCYHYIARAALEEDE